MSDIMLAIKPRWAQLIYSGEKTIEYRRQWPVKNVGKVYLYESSPVCAVTGYFTILQVLKNPIEILKYGCFDNGCITEAQLRGYFEGLSRGYEVELRSRFKYVKTHPLSDFGIKTVPQNFCYIREVK